MTKTQALAEIQQCRQAIKDLQEDRKKCWEVRGKHIYYHPPTTPGTGWTSKEEYYKDKINKLKQKYFFTEQI